MREDDKKQITPEGYYSIDEMCQLLNLKKSTFNTARTTRRDKLPPEVKIGKLILYDKESFKKWLQSHEKTYEEWLKEKGEKRKKVANERK